MQEGAFDGTGNTVLPWNHPVWVPLVDRNMRCALCYLGDDLGSRCSYCCCSFSLASSLSRNVNGLTISNDCDSSSGQVIAPIPPSRMHELSLKGIQPRDVWLLGDIELADS